VIEIALTWCAAGAEDWTESPMITMMKTASSSSVVVSCGSRGLKRMSPPPARAPTTSTIPSTSSAFANTDPISDVLATTTSPADRAKMTMKNSGRFPSDDCRKPVIAGPKRAPTCSVANDTIHASPASARPDTTNVTVGEAWLKCRTPAAAVNSPTAARIRRCRVVRPPMRAHSARRSGKRAFGG